MRFFPTSLLELLVAPEAKFYEIDDWFETSNQLRCCSLWGLSRVLELSKRKPTNPVGFFFVQTCVSSGNVGPNTDNRENSGKMRSTRLQSGLFAFAREVCY